MAFHTLVSVIIAVLFLVVAFSTARYVSGYENIIVSETKYHIRSIYYYASRLAIDFNEALTSQDKEILSLKINYADKDGNLQDRIIPMVSCEERAAETGSSYICNVDFSDLTKRTQVTVALVYNSYTSCMGKTITEMVFSNECKGAILDTQFFWAYPETVMLNDFSKYDMIKLIEQVKEDEESAIKLDCNPRFSPPDNCFDIRRDDKDELPYFEEINKIEGTRVKYGGEWIKFDGFCNFKAIDFRKSCKECDIDKGGFVACDFDAAKALVQTKCVNERSGTCKSYSVDCGFCEIVGKDYIGCYACKIKCTCEYDPGWLGTRSVTVDTPCEGSGEVKYEKNNIKCGTCGGDRERGFVLNPMSARDSTPCTIKND